MESLGIQTPWDAYRPLGIRLWVPRGAQAPWSSVGYLQAPWDTYRPHGLNYEFPDTHRPLGALWDTCKPLRMLTDPLGLNHRFPESHRPLVAPWDTYRSLGAPWDTYRPPEIKSQALRGAQAAWSPLGATFYFTILLNNMILRSGKYFMDLFSKSFSNHYKGG